MGSPGIRDLGKGRFAFPDIEARTGADPRWSQTLDTLRAPPKDGKRSFDWRRTAPIRPLVFEPPPGLDETVVQMHLSHRVVQRLLGRFTAQGFVLHDLSRTCLVQTEDRITRVVLLARLGVFGPRAARLHEEILSITAQWIPPDKRNGPLAPFAREAEAKTMTLLHKSLAPSAVREAPKSIQVQLSASIQRDIGDLATHLEARGTAAVNDASAKLTTRGEAEATQLIQILQDQRRRVQKSLQEASKDWSQLPLPIEEDRRKKEEAERKQRKTDIKYWDGWLANVDEDLKREPTRIREFYSVKAHRVEPIGLVYLWPG
jgi:hypothetical protein